MTTHARLQTAAAISSLIRFRETDGTGQLRASKGAPQVCGAGTVCSWEGTLFRSGRAEHPQLLVGNTHIRVSGDPQPLLDVSV